MFYYFFAIGIFPLLRMFSLLLFSFLSLSATVFVCIWWNGDFFVFTSYRNRTYMIHNHIVPANIQSSYNMQLIFNFFQSICDKCLNEMQIWLSNVHRIFKRGKKTFIQINKQKNVDWDPHKPNSISFLFVFMFVVFVFECVRSIHFLSSFIAITSVWFLHLFSFRSVSCSYFARYFGPCWTGKKIHICI